MSLGDPFTEAELAAWRGMLEANARVTRTLDAEMRSAHGLSVSAYEVLMFLAEAPEPRLRMSEIADQVLLSRSGLTRLIDRLVDLGYVARSAVEGDARGAYAELTDAGAKVFEIAQRTHRQGVRRAYLSRLTTTDVVVLGDIWTRFLEPRAGHDRV